MPVNPIKPHNLSENMSGRTIGQCFDRSTNWVIFFFVFLFILSGVITLPNYGITWDEGLGNLFFGEKNFRYLTSFDPRNININIDLSPRLPKDLALNLSPWRQQPFAYPALTDLPPTITKYFFSYWLKWLNPIDGFHLYTILLAGLFLWFFFRFAASRLGKFAAFLALVFLGTFPRFWGDMHFNVKDVPETVFFSLTLMTYLVWYESPSWKKALTAGVLMGCSIGVKANGIFIPFFLLAAIMPWSVAKQSWLDFLGHFRKYYLHYGIMVLVSVGVYILSWPFLYANPFLGLKQYWGPIFHVATGGGNHWQIGPLLQTVTTMPEIMLIFLGIGLVFVIGRLFRENKTFWRLMLVWLIFPILRVSIPGAENFDGIRHFLEFVPAAALVAGFGLERSIHWVAGKQWMPQWSAKLIALTLILANLFQIYFVFYPYLHLYYNQFTGGLSGAKDQFLGREATDYWAGSYRPGMEWLNENAPPNSKLVVLVANWVAYIEAPVLLRSDIQIVNSMPDGPEMQASPEPYYIMFILRAGLGNAEDEVEYTMNRGTLVHQIVVDQVPVLYIYRFGGKN
jgi:4-amino-4-deoxy-L-arabinose transferase-like glycosyltransferase